MDQTAVIQYNMYIFIFVEYQGCDLLKAQFVAVDRCKSYYLSKSMIYKWRSETYIQN